METLKGSSYFCSAEDLVLGYSKSRGLSQAPFSFLVPRGKITALIGPNGAGKTTLLKAFLGEPVIQAGRLTLHGEKPAGSLSPRELSSLVAFVPQEHRFPPQMKVSDLLRLAFLPTVGTFGKLPPANDSNLVGALKRFDLDHLAETSLKNLSTGERQRAFLARALLQKPRSLLIDEPTNHLDPSAVGVFGESLVRACQAQSVDILISTHDLLFARRYCDWILSMKKGAVIVSESAKSFWDNKRERELFGSHFSYFL